MMPDDQFGDSDYLDMMVGEGKLTEEEAAQIRNPPFEKCAYCGATEKRDCTCWDEDR